MVDSGASFHLISKKYLTKDEKAKITPFRDAIKLQTANGVVKCNEQVPPGFKCPNLAHPEALGVLFSDYTFGAGAILGPNMVR